HQTSFCTPPQWICGSAALRLAMVRRYVVNLGGFAGSNTWGDQRRIERDSLLGNRHWRICPYTRIRTRALGPLVSIQHLLSVLPISWTCLETSPPLGMEPRNHRPKGGRGQLGSNMAA